MSQLNQSPNLAVIGLSLATAPFLGTLWIAQALAVGLEELGQGSEEIFRGDRLPILPFPESLEE